MFSCFCANMKGAKYRKNEAKSSYNFRMNRDELIRLIAKHQKELDDFGVKSLSVFGSVARGEAGPESDVDLLVEFKRPIGLFEFIDLREFLEKELQRPVDLVTASVFRNPYRKKSIYADLTQLYAA